MRRTLYELTFAGLILSPCSGSELGVGDVWLALGATSTRAPERWRSERLDQLPGRNPASVTVTSRRTAAFEGRLLAAERACRQ